MVIGVINVAKKEKRREGKARFYRVEGSEPTTTGGPLSVRRGVSGRASRGGSAPITKS